MSLPGLAVAIIPVRLDSQRLPGKALLAETGRALFLHTWERARAATRFDRVLVATDDPGIAAATQAAGGEIVMTSEHARTGSERCAEAAVALGLDASTIVVDIQGDWPEISPQDLDQLVDCLRTGAAETATLAVELTDPTKIADENIVKVVRDRRGDAMYFSRAAIPHRRATTTQPPLTCLRHIGVYGFRRDVLATIPDLPSSGLDEIESLEQLRFLENGISMRVLDATGDPWGIETRPDYDGFVERNSSSAAPSP